MTTLHRLVIGWSGSMVVGTAVSVMHWDGSDSAAPPVAGVLTALGQYPLLFPSGLTVTVPGVGDSIDDTTGELVGVWSAAGGGSFAGSNAVSPAAGVGACIGWTTGGIVTGAHGPRKLRGRTFLVPLSTAVYENNGTISAGSLTQLQDIANDLMAAGPLAVWHRPTTVGGSDGNSYGVISAKVRDKVAFLGSRRD